MNIMDTYINNILRTNKKTYFIYIFLWYNIYSTKEGVKL